MRDHLTCSNYDPEEWRCLCQCEEFPGKCDKCVLHSEYIDLPAFFGGFDPEEAVCRQ